VVVVVGNREGGIVGAKKKTTAEKIQDQQNRLELLKAKQAYETARAKITGKK
jgi:hypothetical protein